LSRREFARLLLGGATASLLGNCAPERGPGLNVRQQSEGAVPRPVLPTATTELTVVPTPVSAPTRPTLSSKNVGKFYVRYFRDFKAPDPDRWTLAVDGLVRKPQRLSLSNVLALPAISQASRMKCVECWSAAAKWEGFHLSTLMELAEPDPKAAWVHFRCADGYYESMRIEALLQERVLFVHHMNDEILPDIYGAPLRLMVPFRYGYKSAKAIESIEFAEDELYGYWSTVGYTTHGEIRPGRDNPLDLPGVRQIEGGVEIFYPEGIESQ
jgi:DMSO/TMAO reductase YedYZ molybdopterin-dependent catalytic subunit